MLKREQFAENFRNIKESREKARDKAGDKTGAKNWYDTYEIADSLTRNPHSIRAYLNGTQTPPMKVIVKLSNLYEVSPNAFLAGCYRLPPEYCAESLGLNEHEPDKHLKTVIEYFYEKGQRLAGAGFGKRLQIIMSEELLTPKDVAEAVYLSESTIKSLMYKGRAELPSLENFIRMAEFLHTSPHYLLQDELTPNDHVDLETKLKCLTPMHVKVVYELWQEDRQ